MEQNIKLMIGDNAAGKTRHLIDVIRQEKKKKNRIVTNIPYYKIPYAKDKAKFDLLKESNNRLFDDIIAEENIDTSYKSQIAELMKLLYSKGDILVLDEIDSSLEIGDIAMFSKAIADIRKTWKNIYVNGYQEDLLRMFVDTDFETYDTNYIPCVNFIDQNMNIINIPEDDIDAYFNKIRR